MKRMPWTLAAALVLAAVTAPGEARHPRLLLGPSPLPTRQPIAAPTIQPLSIQSAYLRLLEQARLRAGQPKQKEAKPSRGDGRAPAATAPRAWQKRTMGRPFRGFDWTLLGVGTRVRDQGNSGTCWAHAGVEALEASVEIRTATFPPLAVQPVLDQLQHVRGGEAFMVFPELMGRGTGLERDHPFLAGRLNPREKTPLPYRALTWGYLNQPDKQATVAQIKRGLRLYGPLYTCMYAGTPGWKRNRGELLAGKGPYPEVNHAVLVVGWDDNKMAWKVKNSHSTNWGDGGFGYVAYGHYNIGTGTAWVQALVP
jgi:C1A family cysteine protease